MSFSTRSTPRFKLLAGNGCLVTVFGIFLKLFISRALMPDLCDPSEVLLEFEEFSPEVFNGESKSIAWTSSSDEFGSILMEIGSWALFFCSVDSIGSLVGVELADSTDVGVLVTKAGAIL